MSLSNLAAWGSVKSWLNTSSEVISGKLLLVKVVTGFKNSVGCNGRFVSLLGLLLPNTSRRSPWKYFPWTVWRLLKGIRFGGRDGVSSSTTARLGAD